MLRMRAQWSGDDRAGAFARDFTEKSGRVGPDKSRGLGNTHDLLRKRLFLD
jgi:hypothetical protein